MTARDTFLLAMNRADHGKLKAGQYIPGYMRVDAATTKWFHIHPDSSLF
jgi:hypothetical protein